MAKYALCVGINNYPGTGNDLSGCVNDARDWKQVLEERKYEVSLLLDDQAKKANIIESLRTLVAGGKEHDTIVFTFSGHGSWIPDEHGDELDGMDEMICPWDIDQQQYLLDDELADLFESKHPGVRIFFISDSCHSGTVSKFEPVPIPPGATRPRFLPPATFLKKTTLLDRCMVMTRALPRARQKYPCLLFAGCRDMEYSYDATIAGRPNGAFTHAAIDALKGKPDTPSSWMREIRKTLPSRLYPQTPQLFGSRSQKSGHMF